MSREERAFFVQSGIANGNRKRQATLILAIGSLASPIEWKRVSWKVIELIEFTQFRWDEKMQIQKVYWHPLEIVKVWCVTEMFLFLSSLVSSPRHFYPKKKIFLGCTHNCFNTASWAVYLGRVSSESWNVFFWIGKQISLISSVRSTARWECQETFLSTLLKTLFARFLRKNIYDAAWAVLF